MVGNRRWYSRIEAEYNIPLFVMVDDTVIAAVVKLGLIIFEVVQFKTCNNTHNSHCPGTLGYHITYRLTSQILVLPVVALTLI